MKVIKKIRQGAFLYCKLSGFSIMRAFVLSFMLLMFCGSLRAAIVSTFFVDANGTPHLTVVDDVTVDIASPVDGMLVYCRVNGTPMIHVNGAWTPFSVSSTSGTGVPGYFKVSGGISHLSVLASNPASTMEGAIYFNSTHNMVGFHDGNGWLLLMNGITVIESSTTGRIWMDRNLGASQKATASNDALAYGSLFQWCRGADGHELRTSGTTTTLADDSTNVGHTKFIRGSSDWMENSVDDGSLWWDGSTAGANNPCPAGFHVPTKAEWEDELTYMSDAATALDHLALPLAGDRNRISGVVQNVGVRGYYWSSSEYGGTSAHDLFFTNALLVILSHPDRRAMGFSVRCIKDL